jgi:hypothetical protein
MRSFFLGGFECACQRRADGRQLDLLQSTRHDIWAAKDYEALGRLGIRSVRDGVRWHRIETVPRHYDWGSVLPMLWAARSTGTQVIWDLGHYGWPPDIDIWSPMFVDRFAAFAGAFAALARDESPELPYYCPINEISFWAWAGGEMGYFEPMALGRGDELKRQLARASIAGMNAILEADPRARFLQAEPLIHVHPAEASPWAISAAHAVTRAQFAACDMLSGRSEPQLGGHPGLLDIVGLNFYAHNQWILDGPTVRREDPRYRAMRQLIADAWHRYKRPLMIAETGAEGDARVPWFNYVCDEVAAAMAGGIPIVGICIYPVTVYPGWDDDRFCPTGLLGDADPQGNRPVCEPLAAALAAQQRRFEPAELSV